VDPLNKRKVSPLETFFLEEVKIHHDQEQTFLTSDDFDFIIVAMNDASVEIAEKKAAK
jgi:hypothetical protein